MPTDWLPGTPPTSGAGNYLRLKDLMGYPDKSADLRCLLPFIHGWEVWVTDGKPVRAAERERLPAQSEWRVEEGKRDEPKQFWATAVWNATKERPQVFSFTQGTIYNQLRALLDNKKWGALDAYDITIKASGEGLKRKYDITPNPKEALPAKAQEEWTALQASWTGLAALYSGGDPFASFDEVPF